MPNPHGDAASRVAAGAEELDQVKPDWWTLIDYDILCISDGDVCILGQTFAQEAGESGSGYSGYGYALFMDADESPLNHVYYAPAAYGFCGNGLERDEDRLRTAWIHFIEGRKAEVS